MSIKNFGCKETEKIWNRKFSKKLLPDIQTGARRKLVMLDAASTFSDLKKPPRNRLEKMTKDRKWQCL